MTFQEYFEKLGQDARKWAKPFSALLGAYYAQSNFEIPAIGGKDSMSGTFKDIDVPPTLVSFAVNTEDAKNIVSQEFKVAGHALVLVETPQKDYAFPDFDIMKKNFDVIHKAALAGKLKATYALGYGGLGEAIAKMAFGNRIGFKFDDQLASRFENRDDLFRQSYGSILVEIDQADLGALEGANYVLVGQTIDQPVIDVFGQEVSLDKLYAESEKTLEPIFPTKAKKVVTDRIENISYKSDSKPAKSSLSIVKPRVFLPAFPGTNCEYDSARAFERAGAEAYIGVFRNMTYTDIELSLIHI